ncbi:hypothetical protein J1792_22690 [Streptomyces triculaminicus]|uniref:DUF7848 domain-containing protein n=2 Tax=Streptomyces TaxID=1883 RepID=A0A939JS50_9ACTN|nr:MULTISPECIES: hypothetical protein [Streptomyces]MBO0655482.1 hypothetical protein [Streptomyces triculaminicus]QSY50683.1 hypothetical protein J3S04_07010 [Streptomyces griseocarneus]
MTRSVFRFAQWSISQEKVAAVPQITHELECVVCHDSSGPCRGFETARDWAFRHSGLNPSHTAYRETAHRNWRATLLE